MNRRNKKEQLIEATMQVVAENGLPSFSMRKVTMKVGVSEALIYRHFLSKENLFEICFERIVSILGEALESVEFSGTDTPEGGTNAAKAAWLAYLKALVDNSYRSMFFFEYREYYNEKVWAMKDEIQNNHFSKFASILNQVIGQYGLYERVKPALFWAYITDVTSCAVKRMLRGQLEYSDAEAEKAWNLIWGGISGLLLS